jgi:hypothetical protein
MTDTLPEGITNALKLLEASFGPITPLEQARSFKNAVYLLNDCIDEFPIYREDILKIKYSYTVRLLCSLKAHLQSPDYASWLEFVLLLCIDLKYEIKALRSLDTQLFEYVLTFLGLYSGEITPELKTNITHFIKDAAQ